MEQITCKRDVAARVGGSPAVVEGTNFAKTRRIERDWRTCTLVTGKPGSYGKMANDETHVYANLTLLAVPAYISCYAIKCTKYLIVIGSLWIYSFFPSS